MIIARFFKVSSLNNKIRPITSIPWVLRRVEKMPKTGSTHFYLLKVTEFHGDTVKNESARTKN